MLPNLWLPDLIPNKQTSSREDQVLSLEEQINAWYRVNQKMAWGIQDVEFEKLSASLPQILTGDDRVFGYIGVALFYGFGDDGQDNADSTLSGKLAWEYAGKHRKKIPGSVVISISGSQKVFGCGLVQRSVLKAFILQKFKQAKSI